MEKHIGAQTEACYSEMASVNVYGCSEVTFSKKQKALSALRNISYRATLSFEDVAVTKRHLHAHIVPF